MTSLSFAFAAAAAFACSGLPSLFLPRRSRLGQRLAAVLMAAGGALGLAGLCLPIPGSISMGWALPWGGFAAAVDPLSSLFLALIFVVPPLGSIYALGYRDQAEHPRGARRLSLSYGLLAAAMALVVVARDGILFLLAWELMALAAYFAATVEEGRDVRRAGWIYLIATHVGSLCLFAMFALWRRATGGFSLEAAASVPSEAAGAIFVLALVGFGFKAGLVPLHFWLPGAHANAPSHVSAVMSGVMLKMGAYGILRMSSLMPNPPDWWGATLLAAGAATGLIGIVLAIGQSDLKRVLAYSSVENLGIVAMGLGLALLGSSRGLPGLALLGLAGALLHVWNHGLFKSLLFLGAGSVIHATGTREIERLGGLAKRAPALAFLFLAGAVSICALPPMNGFASEWLLYLGFFRSLSSPAAMAAIAAAALAMIGALAVLCFARLYGGVFLGSPRAAIRGGRGDPGLAMAGPMALLALGCAALGLFPALAMPAVLAAARSWGLGPASALLEADLSWISWMGLALIALCALALLALRGPLKKVMNKSLDSRDRPTWDCGYAAPTARMQYTASSFGSGVVAALARRGASAVRGYFPAPARFEAERPEALLDGFLPRAARAAERFLPRIRALQRGQTHLYLLYVLAITIALLAFGGLGVPL